MASIIPNGNDKVCFICGREGAVHLHHCIHGTAGRAFATKFGLTVYLCPNCHQYGEHAVHRDDRMDRMLKRIAQKAFEDKYGHELWQEKWGKNYL